MILEFESKKDPYQSLSRMRPGKDPRYERIFIATQFDLKAVNGKIPIPDGRTSTHDPRVLRHSNLHVTYKYLQATPERERVAQGKLVDAILPGGLLSVNRLALIQ